MARLIPLLLPAPRGNLPVPYAQPPEIVEPPAALPAPVKRAKPGLPVARKADPRGQQRRRISRWVCDHYRTGQGAADRGVLCDFSA